MPTTLTQSKHTDRKAQGEGRKSVQLRLRPSVYEKVQLLAEQEGVAIGYLVEQAILAFDGLHKK